CGRIRNFLSHPRHLRRLTLFPYTTLFRSCHGDQGRGHSQRDEGRRRVHGRPHARLHGDEVPYNLLPASAGTAAQGDGRDGHFARSEEHTSELQSLRHLVCRLLLEKKKTKK